MSFYKTKLCKHWLKHGNCQLRSKPQFGHGECELERMEACESKKIEHDHKRLDYKHETMEHEPHKLVRVDSYIDKHETKYESKYYHHNDKQKSKKFHHDKILPHEPCWQLSNPQVLKSQTNLQRVFSKSNFLAKVI